MAQPSPPAEPPAPPGWMASVRTLLIACAGGVLGTLGAILEESTRLMPLAFIVVGPMIEEIMKPIGMIVVVEKRPQWIQSAGQLVVYAVLGAFIFATIENVIYVAVYYPEGGAAFAVFRFAVCTALHLVCTTIFALGLVKVWRRRMEGGPFDFDVCMRYVIAAVAIHGLYNASMFVLEWLDVLKFVPESTGNG